MMTKYNIDIDVNILNDSFKRIINLTYKLLPMREEKKDWQRPLEIIIEELCGLYRLFIDLPSISTLFALICKLEGLFILVDEKDFNLYRRTIFECLALLNGIKNEFIR